MYWKSLAWLYSFSPARSGMLTTDVKGIPENSRASKTNSSLRDDTLSTDRLAQTGMNEIALQRNQTLAQWRYLADETTAYFCVDWSEFSTTIGNNLTVFKKTGLPTRNWILWKVLATEKTSNIFCISPLPEAVIRFKSPSYQKKNDTKFFQDSLWCWCRPSYGQGRWSMQAPRETKALLKTWPGYRKMPFFWSSMLPNMVMDGVGSTIAQRQSVTGSHPRWSGRFQRPLRRSVNEEKKKTSTQIMADTYDRGGVVTVAWHFNNPVFPGDFTGKTPFRYRYQIHCAGWRSAWKYKTYFATSQTWWNPLKVKMANWCHDFRLIMNWCDWFWWGRSHWPSKNYHQLEVYCSYLRDSMQVHTGLAFRPIEV